MTWLSVLEKGCLAFHSWHKARIFGTRFLMQYYRSKLQCEVVYFHPRNEDEAYKSYIFQSERLDSSWPRPMVSLCSNRVQFKDLKSNLDLRRLRTFSGFPSSNKSMSCPKKLISFSKVTDTIQIVRLHYNSSLVLKRIFTADIIVTIWLENPH